MQLREDETLRGLDRLARLQHLHRAGYWNLLSERNVEASFVERVFADVFGYRTLLESAPEANASHELFSQLYVPLVGGGRAYPDFALGHFAADQRQAVVTAELKSPGADLDAPQGGNYGNASPVEQAMLAAVDAGAEWCVVSNTNEVRLYRVPSLGAYERVHLIEIATVAQLRRALALFSRKSLLARGREPVSRLTRLYRHVERGGKSARYEHPERRAPTSAAIRRLACG
jgi:hypothetical protein